MPRRLISALFTLVFLLTSPLVFAEEALWIDVRSPEEYASNHVSLALNIPHVDIAQRIVGVTQDMDALIYVYCRSGRRSGIAKTALNEMGYTNVVNLGGFQEAQQTAVKMNLCPEASTSDC